MLIFARIDLFNFIFIVCIENDFLCWFLVICRCYKRLTVFLESNDTRTRLLKLAFVLENCNRKICALYGPFEHDLVCGAVFLQVESNFTMIPEVKEQKRNGL